MVDGKRWTGKLVTGDDGGSRWLHDTRYLWRLQIWMSVVAKIRNRDQILQIETGAHRFGHRWCQISQRFVSKLVDLNNGMVDLEVFVQQVTTMIQCSRGDDLRWMFGCSQGTDLMHRRYMAVVLESHWRFQIECKKVQI